MDRRDPLWGVLREQGRYNLVWLARRTGYSHSHVKALAAGAQSPSPRFRAACAALLGMPEVDLFHGDSNGRARTAEEDAPYQTEGVPSLSNSA